MRGQKMSAPPGWQADGGAKSRAQSRSLDNQYNTGASDSQNLERFRAFADRLTEHDFAEHLDALGDELGIGPGTDWVFDNEWHKAVPATSADRGKVTYCGEWSSSKGGIRYPTATLRTYRHGGQSVYFDGYPLVRDMFLQGREATLSDEERQRHRKRVAAARRDYQRKRERMQANAADRARRLWRKARPAEPSHQYLQAKSITPGHARQLGERLVLPLVDLDGHLCSLQFIGPDGSKRFIRGGRKQGCMIPVAGQRGADRILICEGWATGMTLARMEPGSLVLAALDAGNLQPVALDCRRRWPDAEIIICGDADDVGREKARSAALAAGALVAIPDIPPEVGSDWNDAAKGVAA